MAAIRTAVRNNYSVNIKTDDISVTKRDVIRYFLSVDIFSGCRKYFLCCYRNHDRKDNILRYEDKKAVEEKRPEFYSVSFKEEVHDYVAVGHSDRIYCSISCEARSKQSFLRRMLLLMCDKSGQKCSRNVSE